MVISTRGLLGLVLFAGVGFSESNPEWHRAFPPFRIAGSLYYVGTADLAAYLVHTSQGEILINTNLIQDLPALKKNIQQVGFKFEDIKYVLISHAHFDHDEATGVAKRETGAKVLVMAEDADEEERTSAERPGVHVDRRLRDGEMVGLGAAKLVAHLTPGHTPGCTTWTLRVSNLNAVIVGSPNVLSGYRLVGKETYPHMAADFVKTFAVLKNLPCDIFLGAHGSYFGLKEKYAKFKAGDANAFVDPAGYATWVAAKEKEFRDEWARQKAGLKNAPL